MAAKNQNTVVTATQKTEPGAKKDALATALARSKSSSARAPS